MSSVCLSTGVSYVVPAVHRDMYFYTLGVVGVDDVADDVMLVFCHVRCFGEVTTSLLRLRRGQKYIDYGVYFPLGGLLYRSQQRVW